MHAQDSFAEPERTLIELLTREANKFMEEILTNKIDFVFFDYSHRFPNPIIREFRYVTQSGQHNAYFCEGHHFGRDWSPKARAKIIFLSNMLEDAILEQGHVLLEGSYTLDDETNLARNITFCISENYLARQPERTKTCYEQWMNRVKNSPKGSLIARLDLLNYADPAGTDRGDAAPFKGSYSITYEHLAQPTLRFFGNTSPTAQWLLGKPLQPPLSKTDEDSLRTQIFKLAEPLAKDGHVIVEN